ncbi:MAG: peptidoglycan-binding domain-containing protein, partial [Methyloceanibacter sp.]
GRRTADAIAQYEYAYRLPVTGRPSPALLDHMMRNGG